MSFPKRILEEHWLYALGWLGLAAGLALGRAIISISIIVLASAWVFDAIYRKDIRLKWQTFLSNRPALLLSSLPIIYMVSLLYSSGIQDGLSALRTLSPLFILPMIFSSMPKFTEERVRAIALMHVASLIISTLISFFQSDAALIAEHPRDISIFVNHIRLSLMLVMGIVLILRFNWSSEVPKTLLNITVLLWFLYFLWIMQAATGFTILMILMAFFSVKWIAERHRFRWIGGAMFLVLAAGFVWVGSCARGYWKEVPVDLNELETHSVLGNEYEHDLENATLENGHRIWIYIANEELKAAWNKRSNIDYSTLDKKDQPLRGTLLRYLTSLGLRKDSLGLAALDDLQIQEIENGTTSALANEHSGIRRRLDILFFEVDSYLNGEDPSHNSLTKRIEYWKAGWSLFKSHPIMGIGAGNIRHELKVEYIKENRITADAYDLIHNQWLTFMACFGILGFLWSMYVHFMPLRIASVIKEPMYRAFLLVLIFSYMNEDTLNTQAGISFFIFYQGLCVLGVYRPVSQASS